MKLFRRVMHGKFSSTHIGTSGYHIGVLNRENLINRKISVLFVELLTGCS